MLAEALRQSEGLQPNRGRHLDLSVLRRHAQLTDQAVCQFQVFILDTSDVEEARGPRRRPAT